MIVFGKFKLGRNPTKLSGVGAEDVLDHQLDKRVFDRTLENRPARAPIDFAYSRKQLIISFIVVNLLVWIAAAWLVLS